MLDPGWGSPVGTTEPQPAGVWGEAGGEGAFSVWWESMMWQVWSGGAASGRPGSCYRERQLLSCITLGGVVGMADRQNQTPTPEFRESGRRAFPSPWACLPVLCLGQTVRFQMGELCPQDPSACSPGQQLQTGQCYCPINHSAITSSWVIKIGYTPLLSPRFAPILS